jgi:SNF2 family DNA or RNA helicase
MTDPSIKYLIGTKALEMGLNLTKADYVIHLDPPLTFASYDQRCSRARRQGRNDKVISVRMVTAGSLEQRIYKLIESKKLISLSAMPYSLMKEIIE